MSIKSTHYLSRATALEVLADRGKIISPSNKELEDMLEDLPESHFRNYIIKNDPEDLEGEHNVIKSASVF